MTSSDLNDLAQSFRQHEGDDLASLEPEDDTFTLDFAGAIVIAALCAVCVVALVIAVLHSFQT